MEPCSSSDGRAGARSSGGSHSYVEALTGPFAERLHIDTPVRSIARDAEGVTVTSERGSERYDDVVIATHSDQALRMLADPSEREREILGAIPYRQNETVLHTDDALMPRRRAAWASWNFHLLEDGRRTTLTYDMNRLQRLDAPVPFLVTLNRTDAIDPAKVIKTISYSHPVFTNEGIRAQARWREISGTDRTHYCGAYWRWGFHEDGCWSGLRVSEALGGRGPGLGGVVPAAVGSSPADALPASGLGHRHPAQSADPGAGLMGAPALSPAPARRPTAAPAGARPADPPSDRPASAIYEGRVYHARTEPVRHAFSYRIFMPLFDLGELPGLLDGIPLWSARRRAPARLRRSDFLGDPNLPLADAARELVRAELGAAPDGPVRLLANPRYWGIGANPVAFYYLHGDGPGEPLEAMIAEVTNTPWGERRTYVLDARGSEAGGGGEFEKALHVSPFMPMEQSYRWSASVPGERLRVRIANHEGDRRVFEAGIDLRRREITPVRMAALLVRYPPMTATTLARIYGHAAALKLKGVPYFRNPSKER